ncbi:MAG TPA: glycosyltransferase [Baekduia sp.]|uniref:glycosyltransferase n=1 Tax=Baekduia sp. TaxID=2600305 RepID=UPI002D77051D|nr:glycosyltransferase [Baekduia sp.]HET6508474.1 glycosyltransferase [Baekduia sp.]
MSLPSVAVLIAAYEAEPFIGQAVRSALAQDYPSELVHVVVVDDGSTDGTAAVVEEIAREAGPGRLTLVRQENRGSVGAVSRAAQEPAAVEADLLAILDADDAWPAGKLAAQAEVFAQRPDVGLVYTDMAVIDAAGTVVQTSWLAGDRPPTGRSLSAFLAQNLVTGSSIVVRGTLRDVLFPIPEDMAWADWWLAARTAQHAEIAYLPLPRTLYRFHGANMSLGAQGAARLRELRKGLALQRWFLRRLGTEQPVAELERCWDAFARLASEALQAAGTPFTALVEVSARDATEARDLTVGARVHLASGDVHEALAHALRAAAANPFDDDARAALHAVRAALGPDAAGPQPLRGARPLVLALDADDLVRDPALLRAAADLVADLDDVTIAVDAQSFDAGEAADRISALAAEQAIDDAIDLALVTGPLDELGAARLAAGVTVRVSTRRPSDGAAAWLPLAELGAARDALLGRRAAPSA